MNFGTAIELAKAGSRIARAGWNGREMFVFLNRGSAPADTQVRPAPSGLDLIGGVNSDLFEIGDAGTTVRMPNLNMRAADGSTVTGWLASQTDMLAEDWELV